MTVVVDTSDEAPTTAESNTLTGATTNVADEALAVCLNATDEPVRASHSATGTGSGGTPGQLLHMLVPLFTIVIFFKAFNI